MSNKNLIQALEDARAKTKKAWQKYMDEKTAANKEAWNVALLTCVDAAKALEEAKG